MCDRSKTNLHTEAGGSEHLRERILTARHFTDTSECSFIFLLKRFASLSKKSTGTGQGGKRWRLGSSRPVGSLPEPEVGEQTRQPGGQRARVTSRCTVHPLELCLHCRVPVTGEQQRLGDSLAPCVNTAYHLVISEPTTNIMGLEELGCDYRNESVLNLVLKF